ncbi:LysR family transcriptional regulator [Bordetella genomosp. 9]|uniref:LysR family transcriptional regulator n=1 Tax=Bordetella genomosp. 9 TaxID=1416803 RepID=A0A261RGD2_9BORD|nr:LysR family transcriptional regulator [Bordetella genomosp. 9]OZI24015.1 LysR family transcriptional regulator [Bordetella genomosp. 9]
MRLRHLEIFHAVMIGGTLSTAARLLNMTQPAVTQAIASLELQLGYSLFQRIKGRLAPTPEAQALASEVEKLHGQLEAVKHLALNLRHTGHERLRVLAAPALAVELVPAAMQALLDVHPQAQVTVKTGYSSQILAGLGLRKADIGLVYHTPQDHPLIHQERIGSGELVAIVPRDHVLADRAAVELDALGGVTVFVPERQHPLGRMLATRCADHGVDISRHMEIEQSHVALQLASTGLGIAVVDSLTAGSAPAGRVCVRPLAVSLRYEVCVAFSENSAHPHLAFRFARAAQKAFTERAAARKS